MINLHNIDVPTCLVYATGGIICSLSLSDLSSIVQIIGITIASIVTVATYFYNKRHKTKIIEDELRGKKKRKPKEEKRA